jgi:plasmid maintenance system killer protein
MIRSFGDKPTEALFCDERVRQFEGVARRAKRKLEAINAANRLDDLMFHRQINSRGLEVI